METETYPEERELYEDAVEARLSVEIPEKKPYLVELTEKTDPELAADLDRIIKKYRGDTVKQRANALEKAFSKPVYNEYKHGKYMEAHYGQYQR